MLIASLVLLLVSLATTPSIARLFGRDAGWVLATPLLVAAGLLTTAAGNGSWEPVAYKAPWIPSLGIEFSLRLDGLSLMFGLLVLVIGGGVLAYSARYLARRGNHGSFYILMMAFALAMLLLVLADDLIVMFIAWEMTTLCSFFLISRSGAHAREPAIRTLLVTAAGGLSLLAAIAVIVVNTGTTQLSMVLASDLWSSDDGFTITVAVLIAIAAFTKSAQFPFQAWLPDSMVAITPVSAYLHAAAMVKAGIYLLLRFSPVLGGTMVWTALLVTSGLITALLGATAALRRYDLKELLAYSTISQLGLLVVMIGVGTPEALTAAVVHTAAHALFKSALFMLIGVIDHEAGTRDIRRLANMRLRMPVTRVALTLAAASMAGIPLLFGFISKELMFTAFIDAPGAGVLAVIVTVGAAVTSILTLAYSGRIVIGAFSGRGKTFVHEAPATFWGAPALAAVSGLVFGIGPELFNVVAGRAASQVSDQPIDPRLALWHGFNVPLAISGIVIAFGIVMIAARRRIHAFLEPRALPISGLAVVDAARNGIIRFGTAVGSLSGSRAPRQHLAIPVIGLVVVAVIGVFALRDLPPTVGDLSRPLDWVLVVLILAGVIAAIRAQTRIAALVVVGVVGFAITLWFFVLGAADVALTQLLVEILTVTVMVLLLRRLPTTFSKEPRHTRIPIAVVAVAAGGAAALGTWALTGRREMSPAADYLLREGENTTGGANIVNTILVDFRALDTLGELTVLGMAGVVVAALLQSRRLTGIRATKLDTSTQLTDAADNAVFVRTITRVLVPIIIVVSLFMLLRGHQEPGGGFIAALIGGSAFALLFIAAPSDSAARIRWPFMTLIGAGIMVGVSTGLFGFIGGSFLAPLHVDILGYKLTSALIFDVGVYLAVVGIVLATFNLMGRQHRVQRDGDPQQAEAVVDGPVSTTEEVGAR